jgi:hypothetical protein
MAPGLMLFAPGTGLNVTTYKIYALSDKDKKKTVPVLPGLSVVFKYIPVTI